MSALFIRRVLGSFYWKTVITFNFPTVKKEVPSWRVLCEWPGGKKRPTGVRHSSTAMRLGRRRLPRAVCILALGCLCCTCLGSAFYAWQCTEMLLSHSHRELVFVWELPHWSRWEEFCSKFFDLLVYPIMQTCLTAFIYLSRKQNPKIHFMVSGDDHRKTIHKLFLIIPCSKRQHTSQNWHVLGIGIHNLPN